MDLLLPAISIGSLVVGGLGHRWLMKSSSVPKVETEAFDALTNGVAKLLDTTEEDQAIAAANGRKASKAAVAAHLASILAPKQ